MNSHQDRWIDIAYRQEDKAMWLLNARAVFRRRAVDQRNNSSAKPSSLAGKHPTFKWIAVYACFRSPGDEAMGASADANLTKKIILVDETRCPFLAGVFAIVREADHEQCDALTQALKSQAVISLSAPKLLRRHSLRRSS
jgi:hypothetical protein